MGSSTERPIATPGDHPLALPAAGQASVSQILAAIREHARRDAGDLLTLRVVAVPDQDADTWSIFAGELKLTKGLPTRDEPTAIAAGPARLVVCEALVQDVASEEAFWRFARR